MAVIGGSGTVVVLLLALVHACVIRERRLENLFAGEPQLCASPTKSFYPRAVYDLDDFLTFGGGGAVDRGVADLPLTRHPGSRAGIDAVTRATVLLRLCVPSVYRDPLPSRTLAISYPPQGALFPPNLCEPRVEWDDPVNDLWQIRIGVAGEAAKWTFVSRVRRWRFPVEVWRTIRREAVTKDASIQVWGVRCAPDGRSRLGPVQASRPVRFRISTDPADNVVVYRLVPPPFFAQRTPDTVTRDIRTFQTRPFLRSRRRYCFNCHTFSSKGGASGMLAVQARSLSGRTSKMRTYFGVYDISARRGWKVLLPFEMQMTSFMAWSPDGTQLATSANQKIRAMWPMVHETQVVGLTTSDIVICDLKRRTAGLLPGASDPTRLELLPRWTLDGKSIVFCSTKPEDHPEMVRYDLHIVPVNRGNGGEPTPIPGASVNGKSNYYPRFSPDGKWFSFCQADSGELIRSSSDIWMMRANFGEPPRRLECNVGYAADSWHSWSSNGRWLVFASKRDDGVYARLYLTHIDGNGRASPAVRLPLKERLRESFNIPEFLVDFPMIEERELYEAIRLEGPTQGLEAKVTDELSAPR